MSLDKSHKFMDFMVTINTILLLYNIYYLLHNGRSKSSYGSDAKLPRFQKIPILRQDD